MVNPTLDENDELSLQHCKRVWNDPSRDVTTDFLYNKPAVASFASNNILVAKYKTFKRRAGGREIKLQN